MGSHRISLHLAETKTTLPRAPLGRLARQHHQRTRRTAVHLIRRAVAEALVEHRPDEDIRIHLPAREAVVQDLIAIRLHAEAVAQKRGEAIHRTRAERRAVAQGTHLAPHLAEESLHQLRNRHTAGNTVGIDDNIRNNARSRLGHVLGIQNHPACTLLPVARGELVADLGNPVLAHTDLGETVALAIAIAEDAIHPANLVVAHRPGDVAELLRPGRNHRARGYPERHHLANQNVVIIHVLVLRHEAVLGQFLVIGVLHLARHLRIRLEEALLLAR